MAKKLFKGAFKKSSFLKWLFQKLIYLYLKFVYTTSSWKFIFPAGYSKEDFIKEKSVVYALWHNRLAFGPGIFCGKPNVQPLVSPHSDGAIISKIIEDFGFCVIYGSTNKDSARSLKQIIKNLKTGISIVITPDGPRGPKYQINSSITEVARKYGSKLVAISCHCSRSFTLNSWDQLIMPLPFSQVSVVFSSPVSLLEDKEVNDSNLEAQLRELSNFKGTQQLL